MTLRKSARLTAGMAPFVVDEAASVVTARTDERLSSCGRRGDRKALESMAAVG